MELILPPIPHPEIENWFTDLIRTIFGSGDVKTAVTDSSDVGVFVTRIIQDERTVNKYVFCWSEETAQNDTFKLAESVSGYNFEGVKKKVSVCVFHCSYIYPTYLRRLLDVRRGPSSPYGGS